MKSIHHTDANIWYYVIVIWTKYSWWCDNI